MDANELTPQPPPNPFESTQVTLIDVIPEFAIDYPPPPPRPRRIWRPVLLFVITCVSTLVAGVVYSDHFPDGPWWTVLQRLGMVLYQLQWPAINDGLMYSGAVMTILLCHEMGHFVQAWRHGVSASLPYFIPMPLNLIGTFGAVIFMEPRQGNRKSVFDIGISGPLAGLVPTFIFLLLGLYWSQPARVSASPGDQLVLGEPLLMQYLSDWLKGPLPEGYNLILHPVAFAGWVGLLITSINLIPIGQLDGGHILYGMFRRKAHTASMVVLVLAIAASIHFNLICWWLMLGLIAFMGTRHPPTADDSVPLGAARYVLGILTLAFLFFGFTPEPMSVRHSEAVISERP